MRPVDRVYWSPEGAQREVYTRAGQNSSAQKHRRPRIPSRTGYLFPWTPTCNLFFIVGRALTTGARPSRPFFTWSRRRRADGDDRCWRETRQVIAERNGGQRLARVKEAESSVPGA